MTPEDQFIAADNASRLDPATYRREALYLWMGMEPAYQADAILQSLLAISAAIESLEETVSLAADQIEDGLSGIGSHTVVEVRKRWWSR